MPINYEVQPGDCISSIAFDHGFFADTIWNYPANKELKSLRQDPNTLCAGDTVVIPDKREKIVNKPTGEMHKFRLNNTPALCSLQLFDGDDYRANQQYELDIDGRLLTGKTNAEGVLRVPIPPNARRGKLVIGEDRAEYDLKFGQIEPPTQTRGVQARLQNLGYDCPINGKMDEETQNALRNFQFACGLKETAEIDDATLQKLDELHDNVCDIPNRDEVKQEDNDQMIETPFEEEKVEDENQDEDNSQNELKDLDHNESEYESETAELETEDEKSETERQSKDDSQAESKDSGENESENEQEGNESETDEVKKDDNLNQAGSKTEIPIQEEEKSEVENQSENESESESENDEVKKYNKQNQPVNKTGTSSEEDEKAETESEDKGNSQNEIKDSNDNESENESESNESEEEIKA